MLPGWPQKQGTGPLMVGGMTTTTGGTVTPLNRTDYAGGRQPHGTGAHARHHLDRRPRVSSGSNHGYADSAHHGRQVAARELSPSKSVDRRHGRHRLAGRLHQRDDHALGAAVRSVGLAGLRRVRRWRASPRAVDTAKLDWDGWNQYSGDNASPSILILNTNVNSNSILNALGRSGQPVLQVGPPGHRFHFDSVHPWQSARQIVSSSTSTIPSMADLPVRWIDYSALDMIVASRQESADARRSA